MPFIDPAINADLFDSTCAIQAITTTRNGRNVPVNALANVSGLGAIPCMVKEHDGEEIPLPTPGANTGEAKTVVATHTIRLKGYYPIIHETHKAVVGDRQYNILQVIHSSLKSRTKLKCSLYQDAT